MKLSKFGQKFTSNSGILELMDDLGNALSGSEKKYMLGGGNPAQIPEIQKIVTKRTQELLKEDKIKDILGNYDTPQGDVEFLKSMSSFLKRKYGWNITEKNIAITPGSQASFFMLFNMLAGEFMDGSKKSILLPLSPEYIGYSDQGISTDLFISHRAKKEFIDDHIFKYHVDFSAIDLPGFAWDKVAAICASRPTNPTGNVLTNEEVSKLSELAKSNNIPLILDNAYGAPFPHIIFNDIEPIWDDHIILTMSLSKIGLPSARTGIVVANEETIRALSGINAIMNLANTRLGQHILRPLLDDDSIIEISENYITPFYKRKSEKAQAYIKEFFDYELPYYVHKSEGCLFLWLWFKDLPITTYQLYERLKERHVIVVPGQYFYPGIKEEISEINECIRMSFAMDDEDVKEGIRIMADEVKKAYTI